MTEAELTPSARPPQKLLILGGVAAVFVGVAIGVAVAISGPSEEDPGLNTVEAPSAPGAYSFGDEQTRPRADATPSGDTSRPGPDTSDPAPSDPTQTSAPGLTFALRMASKLEKAGEEAAALEVLDEFLRDEGQVHAALEARNDLFARCDEVLADARERIAKLRTLGQEELIQERIAALRSRLPTALHPELDMLAFAPIADDEGDAEGDAEPVAAAPEANNPNLVTYGRLARNLATSDNPEAHFKLGQWAKQNGLSRKAAESFARAVALDGFHEGARKGLGHTFHKGRWYPPDDYKRDVQGLVQDSQGRWVKPEALAGRTRAKKKPTGKPTGRAKAKPLVPPPPPFDRKEDTAWYKDNEKLGEFEDAPEYDSKYYLIKTNVKPEYAKRYGEMLDQYFKRFIMVFKAFLPKRKYQKSEIWIYAKKEDFHTATQMPKSVGGFYNTKTKRVTGYHGLFGQMGNTRDVLAHEGTHQFEDLVLQGKFRNAPIWIIEGLAVYFESAYFDRGKIRIGLVPRERLYALKRGLASGTLIPLKRLIRTPQRSFTGYHYAHAWSLIYMVLYDGKSPKIRKRCQGWFSDLFAAALKGPVSARDVEQSMGGKQAFRDLEAHWKEWLAELPYDYDPKKNR